MGRKMLIVDMRRSHDDVTAHEATQVSVVLVFSIPPSPLFLIDILESQNFDLS